MKSFQLFLKSQMWISC